MKLTRAKMEQLCDKLFERTIAPVKACLKDAGIDVAKIDELVLVGGMTRMPKVVEVAHSKTLPRPTCSNLSAPCSFWFQKPRCLSGGKVGRYSDFRICSLSVFCPNLKPMGSRLVFLGAKHSFALK